MPCSSVPSLVRFNRDIHLAGFTRITAAAVDVTPVARQRAGQSNVVKVADYKLVDHACGNGNVRQVPGPGSGFFPVISVIAPFTAASRAVINPPCEVQVNRFVFVQKKDVVEVVGKQWGQVFDL